MKERGKRDNTGEREERECRGEGRERMEKKTENTRDRKERD